MDTTKIVSEEELQAFTRKVWEESQDKLKETIAYAIRSELLMRAQSSVRQLMGKELAPLVRQVVDEKKAAIQERIEILGNKLVDEASEQFLTRMDYAMQSALSKTVSEPLVQLGTRLSDTMWDSARKVIGEMQKKIHEEYLQRREAMRRRIEAEKAQETKVP